MKQAPYTKPFIVQVAQPAQKKQKLVTGTSTDNVPSKTENAQGDQSLLESRVGTKIIDELYGDKNDTNPKM